MSFELRDESLPPSEYSSIELFETFQDLGLLEHLTGQELTATEQEVLKLPNEIPLLPVFVLLAAPRSALFFGTGLAEQYKRQYGLPEYTPTQLPISIADLERISRGKVQFDNAPVRSFSAHDSEPLDYANDLLRSKEVDGRFYWILFRDDLAHNAGPYRKRMTLFLSSKQRILLGRRMIFKFKDRQAYTWTSKRIEDVLKTVDALHLLDHYKDDEIRLAKRGLFDEEHHQIASVLQCFPDLVYWIDTEMIYEPVEDYADLIDGLRGISRRMFRPTNIKITDADFNNPEFTISFTLDEKEHSIPMEYRGDYVNWDFIDSINQIMKHREHSGRFVILPSDDQTAPIMFLEEEQYRIARKWNLFGLGTHIVAENGLGSF